MEIWSGKLFKKLRSTKRIWMLFGRDLANAYGSVPHQMIPLSLQIYHIPEEISKILGTYFDGFFKRFTTKGYTTNWNRFEVGIAMRCLVSLILFVLAMQLLLKATGNNADIVEFGGGFQMPSVKAFMDDTTIISSKESTTCKILSR